MTLFAVVWQVDSTPTCGFVFASCIKKAFFLHGFWTLSAEDVKDVENVENVQYVEDDVHDNSENNTSAGNFEASVSRKEAEGMIVKTEL